MMIKASWDKEQTPTYRGYPNPGVWYLGKQTPLTRQVGGDHYKTSKVQPIEVIRDWGLGFECGNALKYIARHLKKGEPVKDIEKAIHYLEMYMETLKENLND